ncbi:hypothetical protein QYE76_024719 [Lolium multiflorum]|uniref:Reverse transcriptase n=1 Tax=Lolium multiflorum TaxID=4521 RepID=A0AAD8VTI9_LOLMU|nr:hypothetical protein QYE76_024719 [Lolium multiflorum]
MLYQEMQETLSRSPPIFRYETMWEAHADFAHLIDQNWKAEHPASMHDLEKKLEDLSASLSEWGRNTFGHVRRELKKLKGELAAMRLAPGRVGPDYLEIKVVERIVELQHREEMMWKQRSRIQWLSEGDRNTRFFHMRASKRKKRNRISRLRRQDGSFTEDPDELRLMAREFYDTLYTSEQTAGVEEVLDSVRASVSQAMNDQLLVPFEGGEVKAAMFQMFPLKAPGPDGFPAHFFQKHWDLCGEEVTKAVLRILSGEDTPEGVNRTFIVLIPKVASPEELGQFRPISVMLFTRLLLKYWRIGSS